MSVLEDGTHECGFARPVVWAILDDAAGRVRRQGEGARERRGATDRESIQNRGNIMLTLRALRRGRRQEDPREVPVLVSAPTLRWLLCGILRRPSSDSAPCRAQRAPRASHAL